MERSPTGLDAARVQRRTEPQAWRGVVVFVLRERAADQLESALAGIALGMEIIDVVSLTAEQRAAAHPRIRNGDWGPDGGGPHTFIVACDVFQGVSGERTVEARAAEVAEHTTRRLTRAADPRDAYAPLHHSDGPQQALDYLEVLGDLSAQSRLLVKLDELGAACALPFPLIRMLGTESPGFRARVALVDHPVHGASVCKIFRPGAARYFQRELRARIELAHVPEVPELLDHGPNWLLTPLYHCDGSHVRRSLPNVTGVSQLRPDVGRVLARFARDLHERGMFILDLSPHNLMTDPRAGLKVLDLEFAQPYAGPPPPLRDCYTFRGVPQELRAPYDGVPDLVLTRGVGNSVFHPAVTGARIDTLLRPARRLDALRMAAVQLGWFFAFGLLSPLHAALARRHGKTVSRHALPPGGGGGSLTGRTLRGFAWSFTSSAGQAVLQIGATVALARLLTPAEFGAVSAALLVVGLTQLVTQLGVAAALVHREQLTDVEIASAFWFSLLLSAVFAVGMYVLSPQLGAFVGLPPDSHLLRLLSVTLVLAGATAVPAGLLQRRLRFRPMAVVDLLAAGPATIGVSVMLALRGFGPEALAWGVIVAATVTAVGYTVVARPPITPVSPPTAWSNLRPMIGFGSGYSLTQLGNWLALNADNLVVARLLGTGPLGVYTRAYNLLSEPANVIGGAADKVLFPAMARVRDDGERLRGAYVRTASLVALVTVPASVLLCVLAPEIVHVLLGRQWDAVVLPLQVFALVLLPRTSYKISTSLTRATGAVYRAAWRQWLYAAEVVVFCSVGAHYLGIDGVAIGASAAIVLHFLVMLRFSARVSAGLERHVLAMYLRHVPAAVALVLATVGVAAAVRPVGSDALTLALGALTAAVVAPLVLVLMRGAFRDELAVVRTFRRHS